MQQTDTPLWSWITAAIGFALVPGSAGFMVYQGFAGDTSPPTLVVAVDSISQQPQGYLVEVRVENRGGTVAAAVVVEGVIGDGQATLETSRVTVDYVPSGSQRHAGLMFDRDPRRFDLQLRAKSYVKP